MGPPFTDFLGAPPKGLPPWKNSWRAPMVVVVYEVCHAALLQLNCVQQFAKLPTMIYMLSGFILLWAHKKLSLFMTILAIKIMAFYD